MAACIPGARNPGGETSYHSYEYSFAAAMISILCQDTGAQQRRAKGMSASKMDPDKADFQIKDGWYVAS
jgi:hypothetical protein